MIFFDKSTITNLELIKDESENTGSVLLIDKPINWTSFDIVAKLRSLLHVKKIGHAGTLDPLATGLLIVCIGRTATKRIEEFRLLPKSYFAEFKLGATTPTYDSEMPEENICNISNITEDSIRNAVNKFRGKIEQMPPDFSAKKINGMPAYKLARKHVHIELKPSLIEIYSYNLTGINLPFIQVEIKCSTGTYIRALARDLGCELGCGAYMTKLIRTQIGSYNVNNALSINELIELANK